MVVVIWKIDVSQMYKKLLINGIIMYLSIENVIL